MGVAKEIYIPLEKAAPGLHATLVRLSGGANLGAYEEAYCLSAQHGGITEADICRSPNSTFNPRPARLCHILIQECKEQRRPVLCAALLLPSRVEAPLPAGLEEAQTLLANARIFLQDLTMSAEAAAERIALAYYIDMLRHIHMTDMQAEERKDLINETRDHILTRPHHPENARLIALIQAWLDREIDRGITSR